MSDQRYHVGARSSGLAGVIKLGAVVGVGLLGYILYRQVFVTAGSLRGAKRALTGGE
jgi:hypothetical protein